MNLPFGRQASVSPREARTLYYPDGPTFAKLAETYDLVPVYREIIADFETPLSAFYKLGGGPYRFLLESVEGGERLGRYSILGTSPEAVMYARGEDVTVESADGVQTEKSANPLRLLERYVGGHAVAPVPGLPRFFGGAVGYLGYEAIQYFEPGVRCTKPDGGLDVPDMFFLLSRHVVIFDHVRQTIQVVCTVPIDEAIDSTAAYEQAQRTIDATIERLRQPNGMLPPLGARDGAVLDDSAVASNMTRDEFLAAVREAKARVAAGDVFQVVVSQRFSTPWDRPPLQLYRALRSINPSPDRKSVV